MTTSEGGPAASEVDVTALGHVVDLYRSTVEEIARLGKIRDDLNAALKAAIGDHEIALVGGVPALRRQKVSARRFDTSSFRDEHPEMAERYMVSTESVRLTII